LHGPAGVAVGPDGRLFVVDYENHRLVSWASAADFTNGQAADLVLGQPDFTSNTSGNDQNDLNHPESVAVDGQGNVYVADTDNHRVVIYSPPFSNGMDAILTFGQFDTAPDCQNPQPNNLCFPRGLAMDQSGHLYLVDEFHNRVLVYNAPLTSDTLPDLEIGNLSAPRGLAVDQSGNVYVADSENDRVLAYNTPLTTDTVSDRTFGSAPDAFDCFTDNAGGAVNANTLVCPIDLALDGSGNLYVSDLHNHRVLVYADPLAGDTTADQVFGQGGSFTSGAPNNGGLSAESLSTPLGLAIDPAGNFYVADFDNNRVLAFDAPGGQYRVFLPLVRK
jgi:sugar lactone lactonase YvrE